MNIPLTRLRARSIWRSSAEIVCVIARPLGKRASRLARDVCHCRGDDLGCFDEARPRVQGGVGNPGDLVFGILARELLPADWSAERVAVDQRWQLYEEMATRDAHRFPADARKDR